VDYDPGMYDHYIELESWRCCDK